MSKRIYEGKKKGFYDFGNFFAFFNDRQYTEAIDSNGFDKDGEVRIKLGWNFLQLNVLVKWSYEKKPNKNPVVTVDLDGNERNFGEVEKIIIKESKKEIISAA